MIDAYFDLTRIVTTLEGLLKIQLSDYGLEGEAAIKLITERLGASYYIDFTKNDLSSEKAKLTVGVPELINNLAAIYSQLSAVVVSSVYNGKAIVDLGNVAYLGFRKESAASLSAAMSTKIMADSLDDAFKAVMSKYEVLDISLERKLVLLMVLLYRLGLPEFTAPFGMLFTSGLLAGGVQNDLLFD